MAEVQNLRKGNVYEEEGNLWRVMDHQHIKMGRGSATIRLKVRNLNTGSIVEKTYNNGTRVDDVDLVTDEYLYQYNDGEFYHFMNAETFEQLSIAPGDLEGIKEFLLEGASVKIQTHEGVAIEVKMPTTVDLKIVAADAAVAGDTASGTPQKEVELETGLRIKVPMFVNVGETVTVDTRDARYITRVKA